MLSIKYLSLVAAVATAGLSQFASAAVAWSMPSGTNGTVNYSNGESDNGYFGNPTITGSTFSFTPSNFDASASNGTATTTSDRASFDVSTVSGQAITSVSFDAFGDWSILGAGAAVKEAGALFVTSLSGPTAGQTFSANELVSYTYSPSGPTIVSPANPSGTSDGSFNGTLTVTLPAGVTSAQIVLNNILQAVAPTGTTAFIQKKGEGGPTGGDPVFVIGGVLPEPTSMAALLLGGFGLVRRRRATA